MTERRRAPVLTACALTAAVLLVGCGEGRAPVETSPTRPSSTLFTDHVAVDPRTFDIDTVPDSGWPVDRLPTPATNQYGVFAAGSLWVPHPELGTVSRIDPATGVVTATVPVARPADPEPPPDLQGLAAGDAGIWATQAAQRSVVRIDPDTDTTAERIPVDTAAYALAVDGTTLWIAAFGESAVTRVDLATRRVVARIEGVQAPTGIAAGDGSVWVAKHRTGEVARIDAATNRVVATIDVGGRPENLVRGHGAVWVATNDGRTVAAIDPATDAVVQIPLDGQVFGVTVGDNEVWAGIGAASGYVVRIDPLTGRAVSRTVTDCAFGAVATPGAVWALSDYGCVARIRTNPG